MNPIKDKHGITIQEGDIVRYYDSTTMWLTAKVIDVGGALAVETDENPILLYNFASYHLNNYVYDGSPIPELEIINRNLEMDKEGLLRVRESADDNAARLFTDADKAVIESILHDALPSIPEGACHWRNGGEIITATADCKHNDGGKYKASNNDSITIKTEHLSLTLPPIPNEAEGWIVGARYVVRRDGSIEDAFPDNEPRFIDDSNAHLYPFGVNPEHIIWGKGCADLLPIQDDFNKKRLNVHIFGDGDGSGVHNQLAKRFAEEATWQCANHPPGLEIDVPKGEACGACGRIEE